MDIFSLNYIQIINLALFIMCIGIIFFSFAHLFRLKSPNGFQILLLFGLIFYTRICVIYFNAELNHDESMILSQAITLKSTGGYFWDKVHGGSVGFVNTYVLLLFNLFGLPFSYSGAHFVSACLIFLIIYLLFDLNKTLYGINVGRASILPTLFFFIIAKNKNFVQLASELPSICLIVLFGVVTIRIYKNHSVLNSKYKSMLWFLNGLLLGIIPYSKLQGVPIVCFLGFLGLLILYKKREKLRIFSYFVLGALFVSILNLIILYKVNGVSDFYQSYILDNLAYVHDFSILQRVGYLSDLILHEKSIIFLLFVNIALGLATLLRKNRSRENLKELQLIILFLVLTLYVIDKPGNYYLHYLLFLVPPLTILNGFFINQIDSIKFYKIYTFAFFLIFIVYFSIKYKDGQFDITSVKIKKMEDSVSKKISKYFINKSDMLLEYYRFGKHNVILQQPQASAINFYYGQYHHRGKRLVDETLHSLEKNRPIVVLIHPEFSGLPNEKEKLYTLLGKDYYFIGEVPCDWENTIYEQKEKVFVLKSRFEKIGSRQIIKINGDID